MAAKAIERRKVPSLGRPRQHGDAPWQEANSRKAEGRRAYELAAASSNTDAEWWRWRLRTQTRRDNMASVGAPAEQRLVASV